MSLLAVVGLIAGLIVLVVGADLLVRGASSIARALGISSLIVGLTVVAYGTSAPELAVSVAGAVGGEPEVALGNVLGSNVANVLFILGASALVGGLLVNRRLIRIEVPIMIAISALAFLLASDGSISRLEGGLLVAIAIGYTIFTIKGAKNSPEEVAAVVEEADAAPVAKTSGALIKNIVLIVLGLVALVAGSQLLVNNAVTIATDLGLSQVVIGLTVVALGTSMPELATSITAVIKGDRDIAVGNIIGSNIFNLSVVLGASGLVSSTGISVPDSVLGFDFPIVIAVSLACLPIFFTGQSISRLEGAIFVAYYVAYVAYLVLNATDHSGAGQLGTAVFFYAGPLTLLTIAVLVIGEVKRRRRGIVPTHA